MLSKFTFLSSIFTSVETIRGIWFRSATWLSQSPVTVPSFPFTTEFSAWPVSTALTVAPLTFLGLDEKFSFQSLSAAATFVTANH